MKVILSVFISLLACLSAHSQIFSKLSASKANDYAVVYTLPKTALDIVIESELTEQQPGEFCNYARRYLNIDQVVRKPAFTATIKSVTIVPVSVPDTAARYTMQFKGQGVTYVMIDRNNAPLTINTETPARQESISLPQPQAAAPTPLETEAAKQAVTREMSQSSSVSKRAELAAQRIFELREYRNDLISGQAENTPPDGKSLELSLNNLSAQEAALTAMFAGTTKTRTLVDKVRFEPDTTEVVRMVIARLSPTEGIVDASDLSGAPIYLSMTIDDRGSVPTDDKGVPLAIPKGAVAYRVPGRATISIDYDSRTLARQSIDVAQLGFVHGLDPKIFTNKKSPAFLMFNPLTGAIDTLGVKSE